MNEITSINRVIELERADAARKALEEAANQLETMSGAEQYQRAWRKAADFLRGFKPKGGA
jgi:hypothetical protein